MQQKAFAFCLFLLKYLNPFTHINLEKKHLRIFRTIQNFWAKMTKWKCLWIESTRSQDSYVCPDQSRGYRTTKFMSFYFQNLFNFWGKTHLVCDNRTHLVKKHCWPTNFWELLRTVGWQPLIPKGAEVNHYGQTYQDRSKFPYLRRLFGSQSVFYPRRFPSIFS